MKVVQVFFQSIRLLIDGVICGAIIIGSVIRTVIKRCPEKSAKSDLIVIDVAYTFDQVVERGLEQSILSRSCDGLFDRVWNVHPIVGASPGDREVGPIEIHNLRPDCLFVESHLARSRRWSILPLTAVALTQAQLLAFLRQRVCEGKVAAIRVGDPLYLGLLGYLLTRGTGAIFAIRINGNYDQSFANTGQAAYPRLFRWRFIEKQIERFILPRADLVVAPTNEYLQYAIENGAQPESTALVEFGGLINPTHFLPPKTRKSVRGELGLGSAPLLVSVTRLEPVKYPHDLVRVLALVHKSRNDVVCVIAGDGSLRDELIELARELGVHDNLHLVGNKHQDWLASLLSDADVVLAPMLGRALVEASLSATPIVAYRADWHSELISNGETGILVESRNVEEMAAGVMQLLDQPALAQQLGNRSRADTCTAMSIDSAINHDREAWLKVLNR
jgi:glycosyltransferase involved in cell wall biosynthesis